MGFIIQRFDVHGSGLCPALVTLVLSVYCGCQCLLVLTYTTDYSLVWGCAVAAIFIIQQLVLVDNKY